ncbi:uncharacterized protein M421DRAFT_10281 [Didymella exigua CBS 183.55]|uniref:Uncharacterized protein n=1 Tax=Didymella exigua CBS 183.55 TaxID=1150837 RepID=A0A6A5RA76_9PLEO|nr:uncharacterized protein M421DRAFT_10281 [Didymella exigua CBS 183.55]KAF1922737.1 hypothetical protein M421DRAFT_10281 [Didymella exigua CBS 183.55]
MPQNNPRLLQQGQSTEKACQERNTDPAEIDIRRQSQPARKNLLRSPLVIIVVNVYHIGTVRLDLLQVSSTRVSDLLYAGVIKLLADTAADSVVILVQHLINVCRTKFAEPARLQNTVSVYQSLAVCQAAFRLGITKHTCHVFRKMEAYISDTQLPYHEIDAVMHFGASYLRLYNRMADRLAVYVREETVSDPGVFTKFCFAHPPLNTAIIEAADRRKEWLARREQKRIQREQDKLRWNVERKKHNAERRAEEEKRVAHESAMRQACLAKTRASVKDRVMTAEEKK